MVNPNWGILQPVDVGARIQEGYQQGRQIQAENALSQYAANPDAPESMNALAKFAPQYAIKVREQQVAAKKAAQGEQRDEMLILGKILDSAQDEGSYQQARQVAQQYGIDVSSAPPNFDPNWVNSQKMLVRALSNDKQNLPLVVEELTAAGYRPGTPEFTAQMRRVITSKYDPTKMVPYDSKGGVVSYDPSTGKSIDIILPPGSPQPAQAAFPPAAVEALRTNLQLAEQFDAKYGQGAAQRALGGQASPAPATFP